MTVAGAPHSGLWGRRIQQVAAAAALFAVGAAIALGCRRQAGAQSKPATYINGTAAVWDGDSLTVQGRKVRLFAIDAPELLQTCTDARGRSYACGKVAADALRALVGSASLSCVVVRADRYRRSVARCTRAATFFRRAVDLGEWLLENGHALVYRQYAGGHLCHYASPEAAARAAGRGVWAGGFVPPWEWRKESGWP